MDIVWAGKAVKAAYDYREHIMTIWDRRLAKVPGPRYKIAFVGPGGIGKTALLDHMTGKVQRKGYSLPARSVKQETGKTKVLGQRLAATVAPGQDSGPRSDTYERIFDPKHPVDGVVFVAGYGFETIRSEPQYGSRSRVSA